jgi:peptide deformylase
LLIIDTSETKDQLQVFINPKIVERDGEQVYEEGCLSVPGVYDTVTRAEKVVVEAMNAKGETFKLEAHGLLSVCIQHEMDHLLGKVFVEYLSPLKRTRIKNKMLKQQRNRPM